MKRTITVLAVLAVSGAFSFPSFGSETVTYTYDAKGLLIKVEHSGSTNDGVVAQYSTDDADNRTNLTISGAGAAGSGSGGGDSSPSGVTISIANADGYQDPDTFSVDLSSDAANPVTVHYATHDGSGFKAGHAGTDYTAQSGTLNFQGSEVHKSITVPAPTGRLFEVRLSQPDGAQIKNGTATGGFVPILTDPPSNGGDDDCYQAEFGMICPL